MHFANLYVMPNEKVEDITNGYIEDTFLDDFCYCNGERWEECPNPICDWFQLGGRWSKSILSAKKGGIGEHSLMLDEKGIKKWKQSKKFDYANIEDLTEIIEEERVYGICYEGDYYTRHDNENQFKQLLDKINKKIIHGVVAVIDCHD